MARASPLKATSSRASRAGRFINVDGCGALRRRSRRRFDSRPRTRLAPISILRRFRIGASVGACGPRGATKRRPGGAVPPIRDVRALSVFEAASGEGESSSGTFGPIDGPSAGVEKETPIDRTAPARPSAIAGDPEGERSGGMTPAAALTGLRNRLVAALGVLLEWMRKLPAWQRQRHLRRLRAESDANPGDAAKHARLLVQLNQVSPEEVLRRVESGACAGSAAVVVEYLRALVRTGRVDEYDGEGGPGGADGHRSLPKLLKDLQVLSGGGDLDLTPGGSARQPLYVSLEGMAAQPAPGIVSLFLGFFKWLGLLAVFCFLWLLGSGVVKRVSVQNLPQGGLPASVRDKSPSLAPKQFVKEEVPEKSLKTFNDVKGCPESKEELQDIVEFLKNPERFTRMGATLPKGVLLEGLPGTGKTLLARAVAGEAGVPFFYRAGSEFEEMFVGVGSRRVRALFNAAKKNAPCIVFIDEIDAIGASRKHWENQTRKTLNQLLTEMDGFEVNEGIIVMAATNLVDTLDPALTRAGRFDRHVTVPLPDIRGREEILQFYLNNKPVAPDVDVAELAQQTRGFSGAELYNLVNESALQAAKANEPLVTKQLLDVARDKILMGTERKSLVRTDENMKRTAYHESGHALVALNTPGANPLHKATIVARGNALGMVTQTPGRDEFSVSRQQLMARIDVCMGGKVAEELVFGKDHVTTGASSDLHQATATAEHMVMQCGMSEEVGPIFANRRGELSGEVQKKIDAEVTRILKEAHQRVMKLLADKMSDLHTLSKALVERETLTSKEIEDVLGGRNRGAVSAGLS
ncbi:unnamed protein product [Ostreobium quekettii]|uniref:AAA+ ATPase domain-containing protein n=1 Tax=Ostreobium quekettii TaxID=121088 RepID=A0A8S1IUZ6_9CHLO|nr:unnamed protein product [Ostreobium quekettii]